MATGGRTQENLSEEVLDFVCTPCSSGNKSRRADKFCETCKIYYCTGCLSHHNAIFKGHKQLGPEEFESKPTALLPTEQCGRHGNELQLYCTDHDEVVCNTCVSMQHRSCTRIVFIPNEIQKLLQATPLAKVKADLSIIQTTLKNNETSVKIHRRKLSDKKNGIIEAIENHGQILKTKIDHLIKQSVEDVEVKYQIISKQVQDQIKNIQDNQTELDHGAKQIELAEKQKNYSHIFISMQKCQARMNETEKHNKDFKTWNVSIKLEYDFNREIEKNIEKFTSLGSVIDQDTQPSLYTVKEQKTVQVCQDGKNCSILGSCQLSNGSFLVTDWNHKKIIHLDSSCGRIIDQCPALDTPYDVCSIGDRKAAVSLQDIKTIQFVSWGKKIKMIGSIKLLYYCKGLAFSKGELFVTDLGNHVCVYDIAGNSLRTLEISTPDQSVFTVTNHIAVSSDGQRVHITNDIGLVCVDKNGKHLFTYRDSQLQYASGVCTDDHGSVFVCMYDSHSVIQLSENGKKLGVLLQQSRGIQKPHSVCFDSINKRLLVTMDRNSIILVNDLE